MECVPIRIFTRKNNSQLWKMNNKWNEWMEYENRYMISEAHIQSVYDECRQTFIIPFFHILVLKNANEYESNIIVGYN